jgi:DNA-binding LacI/PurR family transcriptional regulator
MIIETDTSVEDARAIFGKLLDKGEKPRAVFAMSDLQAIGALKAAGERGLKVPEDLAVLGFDDIEAADWMGLSSITQHLGDSGRIAAGLLLDQISAKGQAVQKINLQVGLMERETA